MWNKETKKLASSKCDSDYKGNHYWQEIGIIDNCKQVYKCIQCQKCITEPLQWLKKENELKERAKKALSGGSEPYRKKRKYVRKAEYEEKVRT